MRRFYQYAMLTSVRIAPLLILVMMATPASAVDFTQDDVSAAGAATFSGTDTDGLGCTGASPLYLTYYGSFGLHDANMEATAPTTTCPGWYNIIGSMYLADCSGTADQVRCLDYECAYYSTYDYQCHGEITLSADGSVSGSGWVREYIYDDDDNLDHVRHATWAFEGTVVF